MLNVLSFFFIMNEHLRVLSFTKVSMLNVLSFFFIGFYTLHNPVIWGMFRYSMFWAFSLLFLDLCIWLLHLYVSMLNVLSFFFIKKHHEKNYSQKIWVSMLNVLSFFFIILLHFFRTRWEKVSMLNVLSFFFIKNKKIKKSLFLSVSMLNVLSFFFILMNLIISFR